MIRPPKAVPFSPASKIVATVVTPGCRSMLPQDGGVSLEKRQMKPHYSVAMSVSRVILCGGRVMGFYGHAQAAAQKIVHAFEDANSLPQPLAQMFIRRKDTPHCRKWSWGNQLLVILNGFTDARGFHQWHEVGRNVKKGEKAFYILGPVKKELLDKVTGEEKVLIVGFKGGAVFACAQTEGEPLASGDPDIENWIQTLPLLDVAKTWGLAVGTFDGEGVGFLGRYRHGKAIDLESPH